jgi:RNA polymerase sigma-70 factor (ECF subfamily)
MTAAERERLFVDLFSANKARLLRLCRSYLRSAADAEDLYQDIMVNVWRSLPRFRGDAKLTTWLFRIAVNTALVHQRRHARARRVIEPASGALPEVAVESSPDAAGAEHRLARLQQAIATLREDDRLIITLVLEGLSYNEIARIAGITSNSAGVRISRIKRVLEKRIKDVGDEL